MNLESILFVVGLLGLAMLGLAVGFVAWLLNGDK